MSQLESTLKAMVACFDSLNIPYAVMGGLAVRVHGLPRPTNDVDFTILLERTRLPEWFRAVQTLGYSVPDQYQTGWVDNVAGMPIVKIRTYLSDGRGVDVDVFLAESDFQRSLIERRVWIELDEDSLWVVSPEDLLLLKLIANRPRDLLDAQDILFVQGTLDEGYLRRWSALLGIEDRLAAVLTHHADD